MITGTSERDEQRFGIVLSGRPFHSFYEDFGLTQDRPPQVTGGVHT